MINSGVDNFTPKKAMPKRVLNIRTIKKKMQETGRHGLYKYEQEHLRHKTEDKLIRLAQNLPKLIATKGKKKKVRCFTCDKICNYSELQGCHGISRKHRGSKYKEWNIYACCSGCNNPMFSKNQDHITQLTEHIITTIGIDEYRSYRYGLHKKPSYEDLEDMIKEYEKRYTDLGFDKFI